MANLLYFLPVTRSHKFNDRPHGALAETNGSEEFLPKFFAKNGFADTDPKKTKKNGNGKGNWGGVGEEVVDQQFNFTNARRRSNSSSMTADIKNFKTKFDVNEQEPVFEEDLHGPLGEETDDELHATETNSSEGSVDVKSA
ncbi:stf2-like protein [Niveomyces insectorum RCEF 264]|uniref:Stf2-like protein n=1 Tax=Niveomyces insectorum RCEF 264 TaxID=1081102 RepID=A0A167VF58_9HYPO|nr:stf2-like protein [Niveomyces insectorum RCEF 264]